MKRDISLYLNDILNNSVKILEFVRNVNYLDFIKNDMMTYAVVRALEIIGEAVKHVPPSIKKKYPQIKWKEIAGMRDILTHEYFGINYKIIWSVIEEKLPGLISEMKVIIKDFNPTLI
jgi:uncharacterized protein with HEPN domain